MNTIITISGPSGAGKSTLENMLVNLHEFNKIVSVTTRDKRQGEVHEKDYYFITDKDFDDLNDSGELVESIIFSNSKYGIPKKELARVLASDKPAVIVADPEGIIKIKEYAEEHLMDTKVISLFVFNHIKILMSRVINRHLGEEITEELSEILRARLSNLIFFETLWSSKYKELWDFSITRFDKVNELDVCDYILKLVENNNE